MSILDVRSEILDIAHKYLERVRPSGSENVMALCPFHDDNTASFAMNISNGVYFCHSCHAKGNLLTFLRGVGVSRNIIDIQYQSLIDEARRASPPGPDALNPGVYSLKDIPEHVLGHFDGYTFPSLLEAGFEEKTIRHFDIGFDKWHGRITYPIRDVLGRLVGISGRTIYPGVRPKYKLYNKEYMTWGLPERGEWDRRKVLYNMHTVLPSLHAHPVDHTFLVVVEGFKACMWVWQAGIRNVVGILGSYFSWEHKWLIEQFGGNVYFFLDNNLAGRLGTYDAGKALVPSNVRLTGDVQEGRGSPIGVHVIEYPARLIDDENAQPDSLTSEEIWEQFFDAVPYTTWLRRNMGADPRTRA